MLNKWLGAISVLSRNKVLLSIMVLISVFVASLVSCMRAEGQVLALEITSPQNRAVVTEGAVAVMGIVSSPSAVVEVNGQKVAIAEDGTFTTAVELDYGENRISVSAEVNGREPITKTIAVSRVLGLEITSPPDKAEVAESVIIVRGAVSDPMATVRVNGKEVATADDGTFFTTVELNYVKNLIVVSAAVEGEEPVTETVTVTRVLVLEITSPHYRVKVTDGSVTISGVVYPPSAVVTINGEEIETAEDGTFVASVELGYGENRIVVNATDPVTRTLTVTRELSLEITSPPDKAEVSESPAVVSGVVSDPLAIVTVNGEEIEVGEDGVFSAAVELEYGENEIVVSAAVGGEELVTRTLTVGYAPPGE